MPVAFLSLGSNLGDREANIRSAIEELDRNGIKVLKVSSIIETDPVGGPPQGLFLNAAIKIETTLAPLDLLARINSIESALGRVRSIPNAPRTIDIDILLYNDLKMATAALTIPHPRMQERDFVMRPLQEVL